VSRARRGTWAQFGVRHVCPAVLCFFRCSPSETSRSDSDCLMRLAVLLRQTTRLLMPLDASSSAQSALKRSFARQALSHAQDRPPETGRPAPRKAPKLEGSQSPHSQAEPSDRGQKMPPTSSSSRRGHRGPGSSTRRGSRGSGRPAQKPKGPILTELEGPLRDQQYILGTQKKSLKQVHVDNPKSPLANFYSLALGSQPNYESKEGTVEKKKVFRCVQQCCIYVDTHSAIA
jgi:hypothetical protein